MTDRIVIVFLKAPEKGRVKTRLSGSLDDTFVLEMYKGFVADTLEILETVGDKALYFWPGAKETMLRDWLGNAYPFVLQQGNDLGQKMSNAFVDIFEKGYGAALLIGTDIPELSTDIISSAYKILETADAVIGPSGDGGYYLIGFRRHAFSKSIFTQIDWSTGAVLDQTVQAMNRRSLCHGLLPMLNDIDTPQDLNALIDRVRKGGTIGRRTLEILNAYEG